MSHPPGTPINESVLPAWARRYLSQPQQELGNRALQWVLMFDRTDYLPSSARDLCRRLHIATLGNDDKIVRASQETLAKWTGWAVETVRVQLARLAEDGWISYVAGAGSRRTRIRLTWPHVDPNTQQRDDEPDLCGGVNADETLCRRRAGWGTTTRGIGPCKLHGGNPNTTAGKPPTPQPLGASKDLPPWPLPQPLGGRPVDNLVDDSHGRPPTPQPLGGNPPTVGVSTPQPLGSNPPTVGAPYVREYVGVSVVSGGAAGSQSVRARIAEAIRWLCATYGLTDREATRAWAIAETRAPEPIRNPIRYLSGVMTDNGSLADIIATVQGRLTQTEPEYGPEVGPVLAAVPDWCGDCYEPTRQIGDRTDRISRCPRCHPLARPAVPA